MKQQNKGIQHLNEENCVYSAMKVLHVKDGKKTSYFVGKMMHEAGKTFMVAMSKYFKTKQEAESNLKLVGGCV